MILHLKHTSKKEMRSFENPLQNIYLHECLNFLKKFQISLLGTKILGT